MGKGMAVGYIRVSTDKQDLDVQRLAIHDYARKQKFRIDKFVEVEISSRKSTIARKIESLLDNLKKGDLLIVSELSRLGRSLGQIINIVDTLIKKKIRFIAIKEGIKINGHQQDMQTKVTVTLFGLFAEIERDLLSQRTKEGLAAAKARGKILGRPKGQLGKSRLDGKEDQIREFLKHGVAKAAIARMMGVSRTALLNFLKTRKVAA